MKVKSRQPKNEERPDLMIRAAIIEASAAEGDKARSVRMSVSSEEPVLTSVYINDQYQRVYEVLDHKPESLDLSRCQGGLVVLDRHYGDQIGLIAKPELRDGKLSGDVEFCTGSRAQEIAADAAKGLRRNVSVGYLVQPDAYRIEGERDGIPLVRATRWMPYEASFEPVPADTTVGVNRADQTIAANAAGNRGGKVMKPDETNKLDAEAVVEIYRLARAFNMQPGEADEHIKSGKTVEEFRSLTLKKAEADKIEMQRKLDEAKNRKPDMPPKSEDPQQILDMREQAQIQKRFSIMRVVRHLSGIKEDVGFEREISDEISKRSGKPAQGFIIPHCAPIGVRGMRALNDPFGKTGNGSKFVATELLVGQFIDALRSKMVLNTMGVTTLSGLVGDIAIPKGGAITGGWIDGETGTGTEGKPTVGQVTGTPKTASGWTDITRRMLVQSAIDAEMFVQGELMNTIARLIQVAALAGTGANGQPKGLKLQDNINTPAVTANNPTRAAMIAFITDIMEDNADMDGQSWLMRATGMGLLANTVSGTVTIRNELDTDNVGGGPLPEWLLDLKSRTMLGFPFHVTSDTPNHHLFFGAWSQLVIALWSGADITVDPYSNSTTGAVRIVALQDADILVRHAQAFAYCDDLTA